MGLGFSGAGAGMFSRLFDAGLDLGTAFGRQELLGIQGGVASLNTSAAAPGSLTVTNDAVMQEASDRNKLLLLGVVLIVGAVALAKA